MVTSFCYSPLVSVSIPKSSGSLKGRFPYNRFCRKDRLCRFNFLEATETIIWKRSSQTTEAILAIETILAYGSSEIETTETIIWKR